MWWCWLCLLSSPIPIERHHNNNNNENCKTLTPATELRESYKFSLTVYWRGNIVVTRWQILTHSLECNTQKGVIKEANWRSIERSWWKTGAKHANALNPIDFCCRSFGSSWLQLDVTLLKWLQRRLWVATRLLLSSSVFGSADKLHSSSTEKVPINRATDKKLLSSVFSCKLHSKLPVHFWRNSGTGEIEKGWKFSAIWKAAQEVSRSRAGESGWFELEIKRSNSSWKSKQFVNFTRNLCTKIWKHNCEHDKTCVIFGTHQFNERRFS